MLTNFIMTKNFKVLPDDRKRVILRFLSGLVSSKDSEDESYREFLAQSLQLGLEAVLVTQAWPEIQGPTRIQTRY